MKLSACEPARSEGYGPAEACGTVEACGVAGRPAAALPGTEDAALPPGVLLYTEGDLVPSRSAARGGVPHLVNDLMAAGSAPRREAVVRARLAEMGFDWLGYGGPLPGPHGGTHYACLSTYMPPGWSRSYFSRRHHEVDPRLLAPVRSSLPLVWDLQDIEAGLAGRAAPPRQRQFAADLRHHGMGSGIVLRLGAGLSAPAAAGLPAGGQAVVSLVSAVHGRRWIGDQVLGEALTFGLSLHEFMARHVQLAGHAAVVQPGAAAPAAPLRGLPSMQQEVLRHVLHGLTDKQIADRLQVSPHTVDYHLRQLRQRFGVRNRVQLVSAAQVE